MNSTQAKEIPLAEFISNLGYPATSTRGNDVWFRSPFRDSERTPSFKVDTRKNIWYDFGSGEGGTIIDFVARLNGTRDISSVLSLIAQANGSDPVHFPRPPALPHAHGRETPADSRESRLKSKPTIMSVRDISDTNLLGYLEGRSIPVSLGKRYFKEIEYEVNSQRFRALAFQNDSAGYDVRSPSWKGCVGSKDLTTFTKAERSDFALFEGAFDFVSALAYYGIDEPRSNVIVLNSVALIGRARKYLEDRKATRIHAYLDTDRAGRETLENLMRDSSWEVLDRSDMYTGFKDINEFLCTQRDKTKSLGVPER